jgi:hypothetical protein
MCIKIVLESLSILLKKYFYYPEAICLEENMYLHMQSLIIEIRNLILVTACCCHTVKIEFLCNVAIPRRGNNKPKLCQMHS